MSWIVIVLVASLVSSASNVLDKHLITNRQANAFACTASFGVVALPVTFFGQLIIPSTPWPYALLAFTSGGLYVLAVWLYFKTISKADISSVVPLLRLSSVQALLLGALILGESLTGQQGIGFSLVLAGGILVSLRTNLSGRVALNRTALGLLPVTIILALNTVINTYVYRNTSLWQGEVWLQTGLATTIAVVAAWSFYSGGLPWLGVKLSTWGILALSQGLRLLTGLAPAWAVSTGVPVGLPSAVSGVSPLWVWLLAVLVLREHTPLREMWFKLPGMLLTATGVCLLV